MKILVYDCEIIKAVPIDYKNEAKIEDIEYCEGWHDHANMGISVIGTYNNWNKEQIAFVNYEAMHMGYPSMEDLKLKTIKHFQDLLNECDILVGFNSIRFDNLLIEANGFTIPTHIKQYDILQEMWQAAGLGPDFTFLIMLVIVLNKLVRLTIYLLNLEMVLTPQLIGKEVSMKK
jgi:hypothetical protein